MFNIEPIHKIEIVWEGPLTIKDAKEKKDFKFDYGLYQIYGTHPVYGANSLLYIGKSDRNVFRYRMESHERDWIPDVPSDVTIYLGYFAGESDISPADEDWSRDIDYAERLLIYCCQPSFNVREKYLKPNFENEIIVLNFGKRHQLPAVFSSLILRDEKKRLKRWAWSEKIIPTASDDSI